MYEDNDKNSSIQSQITEKNQNYISTGDISFQQLEVNIDIN